MYIAAAVTIISDLDLLNIYTYVHATKDSGLVYNYTYVCT